jgi:MraZ protein
MVFRGIHTVNMDAKGRMAMPTRYRDAFAYEGHNQLIATVDIQSPCLLIYPFADWLKIEEKLQTLPALNTSSRRLQRLMLGYASEVELDANGRMLVPPVLREYANFEKKLVLAGQGNKFELWSEANWSKETEQAISEALNGDLDIPLDIQDIVL